MAIKLTLADISSGYQGSDIQSNFTAVEDEFDKVVYRDGSFAMSGNLDMNSQRLVNLPAPTSSTEPLRKDDQFTSTEAQAFATDAETAKDAAESALTTFQSQYLGASATGPTQDGNGNALEVGDLYFDTTNDVLKTYDGTAWVNSSTQFLPNVDANVTATEDELNLLDGATVTTAEINILDGVTATTAELNTLDGITSTVTELNKLDGYTGTTADMNAVLTPYASTRVELGGDFDAGEEVVCERIGNTVTITAVGSLSHTSLVIAGSGSNVIPSEYRPSSDIYAGSNNDSSSVNRLIVTSSGSISVTYRDYTGSGFSRTLTPAFTVAYVIEGNIT